MSSGHREGGFFDPRTPWADVCDVSGFNNSSTCSHSDDSGGAAAPRSARTPRSSGYDVYAHAVYVVICYMSLTCICLLYVSRPRTRHVICCYMLYVCDMLYVCYMSSLGGVVRIRLYIIYAHLCNHHTSCKVVVGLGAQLCTQLEVWVLESGCRRLARKRSVHRGSGTPSTDGPEAWPRHLQRQIRAGD